MEKVSTSSIGRQGEDYCAKFYEKNGFSIVARNFHSRFGEIDVVAENDEKIVFVEVKSRKENSLSSGMESVDRKKRKKIILTAMEFLSSKNDEDSNKKEISFDVFEVVHNGKRLIKYRQTKNAFEFDDDVFGDIFV